ncbi:hypothetical protein ScPMuIL_016476 [Solemya velum]
MFGLTSFFEYIPLAYIAEQNPIVVLPHQVKVGEEYEVVVTTIEGLCRYRTEDIIQITGFYYEFPTYKYIRRTGDILNLYTEKLPEVMVSRALVEATKNWNDILVVDYTTTEAFNVEKTQGNPVA